jgi:hypothetical protein
MVRTAQGLFTMMNDDQNSCTYAPVLPVALHASPLRDLRLRLHLHARPGRLLARTEKITASACTSDR